MSNKNLKRMLDDVIRKSWTDAAFKQRLLADPTAALRSEGWEIPAGRRIVVVESTESVQYITLPPAPRLAELDLSSAQVNELVGRDDGQNYYSVTDGSKHNDCQCIDGLLSVAERTLPRAVSAAGA